MGEYILQWLLSNILYKEVSGYRRGEESKESLMKCLLDVFIQCLQLFKKERMYCMLLDSGVLPFTKPLAQSFTQCGGRLGALFRILCQVLNKSELVSYRVILVFQRTYAFKQTRDSSKQVLVMRSKKMSSAFSVYSQIMLFVACGTCMTDPSPMGLSSSAWTVVRITAD